MSRRIMIRRDCSINWESVNPILAAGEIGLDTTRDLTKIGNGRNTWNELPFMSGEVDEDPTMTANSRSRIPTQRAVKGYIDERIANIDSPDSIVSHSNIVYKTSWIPSNQVDWNVALNYKEITTDSLLAFINNTNGKQIKLILTNNSTFDRLVEWPEGIFWNSTGYNSILANKRNLYELMQINGEIYGTVHYNLIST